MTNSSILFNIQALRAFAALLVVIEHSILVGASHGFNVDVLSALEGFGQCGVDLFFVISGFIMVHIQNQQRRTPVRFFIERVARIAPTYWLLSGLIVLLLLMTPNIFRTLEFSALRALLSLAFIAQPVNATAPILSVGWTLEYEMYFYFLFSLSILAGNIYLSVLTTTLLILASFFVFGGGPTMLMLEFVLGMLIGLCGIRLRFPAHIAWTSVLFGMAALTFGLTFKTLELHRTLYWGLPSALIVFGCVNLPQIKSSWITTLGDASYSIYLIQVFTIPAYFKFIQLINLPQMSNDVIALFAAMITAVSGIALYKSLEHRVALTLKPVLSRHVSSTAA